MCENESSSCIKMSKEGLNLKVFGKFQMLEFEWHFEKLRFDRIQIQLWRYLDVIILFSYKMIKTNKLSEAVWSKFRNSKIQSCQKESDFVKKTCVHRDWFGADE